MAPNTPSKPAKTRPPGNSTSNQSGQGSGGGGNPPPTSSDASSADMNTDTPRVQWHYDPWTSAIVHEKGCRVCDEYRQHLLRHAHKCEPTVETARQERDNHITSLRTSENLRDLADRNREIAELERELARTMKERDDARYWAEETQRRMEEIERSQPTNPPRRSYSPRPDTRNRRRTNKKTRQNPFASAPPPPTTPYPPTHPTKPAEDNQTPVHLMDKVYGGYSTEDKSDSEEERRKRKRQNKFKVPKKPDERERMGRQTTYRYDHHTPHCSKSNSP
ncbi:hypothetical protein VKT23_000946 [Stygiomarasmius scandens]|uniref:Uncharacterized protein n=1 Tax=Marasmiellus scandens TaxID=2682957 RepID=A0ABR1K5U4_9AGAR